MKIVSQKIKIDGASNLIEITLLYGNTLLVEFYSWEGKNTSEEYLIYTPEDERVAAEQFVKALVGENETLRRKQIVDEIASAFAAMLG